MTEKKSRSIRKKARTLVAFGRYVCQTGAQPRSGSPVKPPKTITLLLVLVLVHALATAQAKTKKPYKLPAVFNQARYVYVEAVAVRNLTRG